MTHLSRHVVVSRTVLVLTVLSGVFFAPLAWSDDSQRFYTVLDEHGHMRTVERKQTDTEAAAAAAAPASSADAQAPVDPLSTLDGQQYVDSGYLQKREFNLEGRKRFYAVPDGIGGTQVLERVPGGLNEVSTLGESSADSVPKPPAVVATLAEGYQRVSAADISALLNMRCLPKAAFLQAKILRNQPLNLWPRSDAPSVNHKAALNYLLVDLRAGTRDMSLQSFAPLGRSADYYWPLVVFLDDQGCFVEGANAFYQKTLPATMLQQSVLIGTLHVPDHSRYMMLTPLVEAIDLPKIRLSEVGQLRVIPLR